MRLAIIGVVRDGSLPAGTITPKAPFGQPIELPRGEDLVIDLTVVKANHQPADITLGAIKLGLRKFRGDPVDIDAVAATLVGVGTLGTATITVPSSTTLPLIEQFDYLYDIQWTDGGSKRWQLVPVSALRILGIVNRPAD
jgi:hypothetical protein